MKKLFLKMIPLFLISCTLNATEVQQQAQPQAPTRSASAIADELLQSRIITVNAHKKLKNPQFSPDNTKVLFETQTNSNDRYHSDNIFLCNAQTGEALRSFPLDESTQLMSAQFSPDSKQVLTASSDGKARIWDIETGALVKTFFANARPLNSAEFSPDGKLIITASQDKIVRIWDVETEQELHKLAGHEGSRTIAHFSNDGTKIVTASVHTTRIWDVQTGRQLKKLTAPPWPVDWIKYVALSHDATKVFTIETNDIAILSDVETGQEISRFIHILTGGFTPDGTKLITIKTNSYFDNNTVIIRDAQTGTELQHLPSEKASKATFSNDSKKVVISSQEGYAQIFDLATGKLVQTLAAVPHIVVLWAVFSPDDRSIVMAGGDTTALIIKIDHTIVGNYFKNMQLGPEEQALLVTLDRLSREKNGGEITKADFIVGPFMLTSELLETLYTMNTDLQGALKSLYHLGDDIIQRKPKLLIKRTRPDYKTIKTQIDLANQKGDA